MSLSNSEHDEDMDIFAATKAAAQPTIFVPNEPYPRTLAEMMTISLVLNDSAEFMMLHDQQFPFLLNWAEFDADLGTLTFVGFQGAIIELGLTVPQKMHKHILKNEEMKTVLLQGSEIVDYYFIPFIHRKVL